MDTSIQVVIVDDHTILRRAVASFLQQEEDISVIGEAGSGEEFLQQIAQGRQPDVVLLDIDLPRMSGIETTSRLRQMGLQLPVIALSSRDEISIITAMMQAGACNYLRKDTTVQELVAAIRAAYARHRPPTPPLAELSILNQRPPTRVSVQMGLEDTGRNHDWRARHDGNALPGLQLKNEGNEEVIFNQSINLTTNEYRLLCYLSDNANKPISKAELLRVVWHYEWLECTNLVEVAISRLRRKIEKDPANPQYLITQRGIGYLLTNPTVAQEMLN